MGARAKRLVYEVPAKLEVGHVVRASWLAQALEAPCLVVADLEQVDADNSTCKRLMELYQSVVGERLHLVYESELLELGRAYRRLSAKVSVCSLLKHQREVERPLTHRGVEPGLGACRRDGDLPAGGNGGRALRLGSLEGSGPPGGILGRGRTA